MGLQNNRRGAGRIFFEEIFGAPSVEAEEKEPLGNCTCGKSN